jgi:hypothetical protein
MSSKPTPEDPPAYLAQAKFSQKIVCRRTNSAVSFADIGDEGGVPLLWMMPSGGSRWFAVAHGMFSTLFSPFYRISQSDIWEMKETADDRPYL